MFGKKAEALPPMDIDKVDTIIGKGTEIKGNVHASGVLRVDGKVEGEVQTAGDVVVGETGVVMAGICARHIMVAGEIRGNITAQGKLEITPTGKVFGDIKVSNLNINEGAVFEGKCEMTREAGRPKTEPKPSPGPEKA